MKTRCATRLLPRFLTVVAQALLLLSVAAPNGAVAQESSDAPRLRRVDMYICGGYSVRLVGDEKRVAGLGYSFGGFAGSFRLMWQPEYRLAVGFEGGYFPVTTIESDSADGINDPNLFLSAAPIFAMTTMRFGGFDVMGGIGVYSYAVDGTSVKRFGVAASALEIGYTLGLGYTYHLLDRLGVGGELRLYQFTDRPITVVMPALRVRMSIIEY